MTLPVHRRNKVLSVLTQDNASRVSHLATQLGVSVMTVRRDLDELQRQGLVKRVHGGAILPPTPSMAHARHTAVGRIALLVPNLDFDWPNVARGAEAATRLRGLRLLLRSDSGDSSSELPALAKLFALHDVIGVGAVIDTTGPRSAEVLEWLATQKKPFVLIESHQRRPTLESVATDHVKGMHEAIRHLWELGHRRIGCVVKASPAADRITAGWRAARAEFGLSDEQTWLQLEPDQITPGTVTRCLEPGMTGLLVHSDREALALTQQLERGGLRIPKDMSIVSYDDELAALGSPALTAIRPAGSALGAAAIDLLASRQADPQRPVHHVTISPELIVRESTAAVPMH